MQSLTLPPSVSWQQLTLISLSSWTLGFPHIPQDHTLTMTLTFFLYPPSKRDIELLLKLIANLNMLLRDENVNVVKKAILTMTQLYKVALQVGAPSHPGSS